MALDLACIDTFLAKQFTSKIVSQRVTQMPSTKQRLSIDGERRGHQLEGDDKNMSIPDS